MAENRKPILNGNPSVESGYLNNPSVFSTLRSRIAVPLYATKNLIGVSEPVSRIARRFHKGPIAVTAVDCSEACALTIEIAVARVFESAGDTTKNSRSRRVGPSSRRGVGPLSPTEHASFDPHMRCGWIVACSGEHRPVRYRLWSAVSACQCAESFRDYDFLGTNRSWRVPFDTAWRLALCCSREGYLASADCLRQRSECRRGARGGGDVP